MDANMAYPSPHYLPSHSPYYTNSVHQPINTIPPRTDHPQRKRPKYTRSKTGCLTCRVKKIKCDETKPSCMRCTHGSRDCSWPEGVPVRKKHTRRENIEARPSTAESSGMSEASTPPERDCTPPSLNEVDLGVVPSSGAYISMQTIGLDQEGGRRHLDPHSPTNSSALSAIPESFYPSRYDQVRLNGSTAPSRHQYSSYGPQPLQHWPEPVYVSECASLREQRSYQYHDTLQGHSSQADQTQHRYQ